MRIKRQATIPADESLSGPVDLADYPIVGIYMPAEWDAAELTFQASHDGVTWSDVEDLYGEDWAGVVEGGKYYNCVRLELEGIRHLKVRSGLSSNPVNQTAERVITLILRQD